MTAGKLVPLVGKVVAVVLMTVAKFPDVLRFPPKVKVLAPLLLPVPLYMGDIIPAKAVLPSKLAPKIVLAVCSVVAVDASP